MELMDLQIYSHWKHNVAFNYVFVESLRDRNLKLFWNAKESLAKSLVKNRRYYDQKQEHIH